MSELNVHLCPETGICSLIKDDGQKIDLMPDEVTQLRQAKDPEAVKQVLSEVDGAFAASLDAEEHAFLAQKLK